MNEELLKWTITNAFWTEWMAIGTITMAIAIIITSGVAILTLVKTNKRRRYELSYQLYDQFKTFHLEVWQSYFFLSEKEYKTLEEMEKENKEIKTESNILVIFLSKLGLLIRKKVLNFTEIDMYFHEYFSNESAMNNLLKNLPIAHKEMPEHLYVNIFYLLDSIDKTYGKTNYKKMFNVSDFEWSLDLSRIEIDFWKYFCKKLKFWKKDYYRED